MTNIDLPTFRNKAKQAAQLLQARKLVEAGVLFSELYQSLHLSSYKERLSLIAFDKVFPGLGPDDVLLLLFNRTAWCMNTCDSEEALDCIHYYWAIKRDFNIEYHREMDQEMIMREIEVNNRLAHKAEAIRLCDLLLGWDLSHSKRSLVLLAKGSIESDESHWIFNVNSMSEALGEAEADGSPALIGRCYLELAKMVGTHYPALALSFLWKARIIFEKDNKREKIAFCKERMAMSYFLLWHRTNDKRYQEEASRLVNEEIDRNTYPHPGARAGFDRLRGLINNDLSLIRESLDFYEGMHAWGDALRTAEFYIKVALTMGDREEAKKGAKRYESYAELLHDSFRLEYIRGFDFEHAEATWIPEVQQKPLPDLLDVLDMLALDEERFHLEKNVYRLLYPTHYQEGKFEAITMPDGKVRLYPMCLVPYRYYRGQSEVLREKPCIPSLFRGLSDSEMFYERLCLMELEILLADYPITRVFQNGLQLNTPNGAYSRPVAVDVTALGQHYGIKTDVLDVTADKWVAAFFASTKYVDGRYEPCKDDGEGVMYVYNHVCFPTIDNDRLSAVGLQPFSRPGMQAGLVYKMRPKEDFNTKAKRIVFRHDPKISEMIFNYCNRSKRLFPQEILEDKVREIRTSKVHCRRALEMTVSRYYEKEDKEVIRRYLTDKGVTIQDNPPVALSKEEKEECIEHWNRDKDQILDTICLRFSYTGPIEKME